MLKPKSRVVRVMPNVACLVNASCSVYSAGQYATQGNEKDLDRTTDQRSYVCHIVI